ncbi:MAG: hypothetical protein WAW39_05145 [Prosthecobacter sp.]|uniref:hypothetical protein n=1 Tax=Prosthecobacter sp. TaxID=1965333 RepID=UPI003BB0CEBA
MNKKRCRFFAMLSITLYWQLNIKYNIYYTNEGDILIRGHLSLGSRHNKLFFKSLKPWLATQSQQRRILHSEASLGGGGLEHLCHGRIDRLQAMRLRQ